MGITSFCGLFRFSAAGVMSDYQAMSECEEIIRVYDDAGNVIETHQHTGDFKEP